MTTTLTFLSLIECSPRSPDTVASFPRGNRDTLVNSYGVQLLEICQAVPLRILNGRKLGDLLGSYTCYKHNGKSVVDYCLVSPRLYCTISLFIVNDWMPDLSDHCSITVSISTKYMCNVSSLDRYEYITKPSKVHWSPETSLRFEGFLQDQASKDFLAQFSKNCMPSQELLDNAVDSLSSFLVGAAVKAAGPAQGAYKPPMPRRSEARNWKYRQKPVCVNKPKWFDSSLEAIQRQLRITARLLALQPSNPYLKGKLITETKDYKRLRQQKSVNMWKACLLN